MQQKTTPKALSCALTSVLGALVAALGTQALLSAVLGVPAWQHPLALIASLAAGIGVGLCFDHCRRKLLSHAHASRAEEAATRAIVAATLEGAHAVAWGRGIGTHALSEVSANVEQLLGYPRDAWLAPGAWHRFVHPDDAPTARTAYQSGTRKAVPFEVCYRMRHRDGHVVHVRDRVAVVRTADGEDQLRGLLLDITDEHEAMLRVQASEAHFRGVFEQATIGIVICNTDGLIQQSNKRFCEIVGRDAQALVGTRFDALVAPTSSSQTRRGAPSESPASMRCQRPDGTEVWMHVSLSVQNDAHGRPRSLLATVQDITHLHRATAGLAAEESRLRAVLSTLGEGVIMRDADGRVIVHNTAAARIFGLTDDEMAAFSADNKLVRFLREDGEPYAHDELPPMRTLCDGEGHSGVVGIIRRDGTTRWLWVHSKPVAPQADAPPAVVTSIADITRLREAETRLRLADKAIDHSADAILITTAEGLILRVNPAFTRVTGYTADEVIGHTPAILRSGRHDETFYANMWESIRRTGSWQGDIWNRRKDGALFVERLSISAVRNNTARRVSHYVGVFSDVTEVRTQQQRFAHMAHHDSLTGLPNRSLMADRLAQALSRAMRNQRQVALMFLDLDRFKEVNDTLGHALGDALLKGVADRLESCVRDSDSVARQAGDEFLVLLPDLEEGSHAGQVASKILTALATPLLIDGHRVQTSSSVGIALFPGDAHDADTLLSHADTALYHAKAAGRNTFRYFTESMNAESERRLQLEQQLRSAIAEDALHLVYQPLRNLADGRIVAVEAVCRWQCAVLGDIVPATFIANTGDLALLKALDQWTLKAACQEAARWRADGAPEVRMAVNIAARHFRQDALIDTVRETLAAAGLPAERLEIELPERVLHETDPVVANTLHALKSMGVRLVVDEFGTGYNTLTRLKQFHIDRLKMDRSALAELEHSEDHRAIMRAMIDLGRHLKIEVLAEGVETPCQHEHIVAAGCQLGQGVFLDVPMSSAQTLERIKAANTTH